MKGKGKGKGRRRKIAAATQPRWLLVGALVYMGIAATGIGVARLSQETRGIYVALENDQHAQDQLLAQFSRLLLERSTLASYQNVDDSAAKSLGMRFPETVERVVQ